MIYSGALDSINQINDSDHNGLPRYELRSACYRIFHIVHVYYQHFSGSRTYNHEYRAVQKYRAQQGLAKHIALIRKKIAVFEGLGLKINSDVRHSPLDMKRAAYYYLNLNPMNLYTPLIGPLQIISIADLKAVKKWARIMVAIKRVHELRTRNGKLMAFADVTDGINKVSIVFFPIIVINGRVERSPKLQLVANQIWPAANLMRRYQYDWRQHCCYLRIDGRSILHRLYQVIKQNHGPYPVLVYNSLMVINSC
ncbi:MAG: Hypothetical protein AJITA_00434 [Acetilactobacillus jinshanensis]